jgi:glutathione synthase
MMNYPPQVSSKELSETVIVAIDWALAHGLVVRPSLDKQTMFANNAAVTHAPFALYPTPFPRTEFEKAKRLQQPWNTLIHKMSRDQNLISETMET